MSALRLILLGLLIALAAALALGVSGTLGLDWTEAVAVVIGIAAIATGWYASTPKATPAQTAINPDADAQDDSLVFSTALLNGLTDPFLLVDSKRRVIFCNSAANTLFGKNITGDDISLYLRQPAALTAMETIQSEGEERDTEITMPGPVVRTFLFRATRLLDPRMPAPPRILARNRYTTAISLHDITHIRHAEQMRADFVANVSHELRTPLASLVGFIETLQGPASKDDAARSRFLGIMQRESARMTRLIEDLLSLSRIELDEYTPPSALVDVAGVLRGLGESMQPRAEKRKAAIELDIAENIPPIMADRDQLIEVFQNLVDNALKYGGDGGTVTVSARRVDSVSQIVGPAVVVSVTDEGPGIPAEHIPRLTERFYRVDSARSRELGGTGLGLAIVKHIVNRHRGTLTVASKEGAGSTFSVSFPVPRATAAAQ
jgi:two-component system phosphate regulon sensor histidine kinase PhoR